MKAPKRISNYLPEALFFLVASVITVIYTYPLVTNLSGLFYGLPWDPLGDIWVLWWQKYALINDIPLRIHNYLSYPTGRDLSYSHISYITYMRGFILGYFTNEVVAYNIIKLLSFPLLAFTTYLLVKYLTANRAVSMVVGLAYAFSPYHVAHNMSHYENLFWVPLAILFLLKLLSEGGYRNSMLFGLIWGISFVGNAYNAYFIALIIPLFLLFALLRRDTREKILTVSFLKAATLGALVFLAIIFPMFYPVIKGMLAEKYQFVDVYEVRRSFSDLFVFSAKPLDYLMPSKYNFVLGSIVPDLGFGSLKGHRYTEHTLYLGYSIMALGVYAFYSAVRKAGELGRNYSDRWRIYLFFALFVFTIILSAPPFIPLGEYSIDYQTREVFAEHKLLLPQYFLFKIFPMIRVYARIGSLVLLAICILAAFGLREVVDRVVSRRWKLVVLSAFSLLVFVEFVDLPPHRLTEVKEPEVYKWLAADPVRFPIVEYPVGAGDDPYTTYEYFFYQRIHSKYLVNGALKGTPTDEFRKSIVDISKPDVIERLDEIGVRYVLVHEDKYVNGNETVPLDWVTAPPREKLFPVEYNDGVVPDLKLVKDRLRLVKSFGGTKVYELVEGSR